MPNQTSDLLKTAERRAFVIKKRGEGLSYPAIVEAAIAQFGVDVLPKGYDVRYAWKDIKRELDALRSEVDEGIRDLRDIELQRLDEMLIPMLKAAKGGKVNAVDRVIKIMDRRARYLGLDTPTTNQSVDLSTLHTEQLERLAKGEPLLNVLANTGASGTGTTETEEG